MFDRAILVEFCCLSMLASSFGQTRDTDSQTLREILLELRAIHDDMRVTETTQILVAELEMQQSAVSRATESVDTARAKLNDIHRDQKQVAGELQQAEDLLDKATNADERDGISAAIERHKSNIAALKTAERDLSSSLQDMERRLQSAQDKLADIESELNAAISRLGPARKEAGQK